MKPPFDISGDLDTPVSAFMKLQPFRPSFLLESVEGGETIARYSRAHNGANVLALGSTLIDAAAAAGIAH